MHVRRIFLLVIGLSRYVRSKKVSSSASRSLVMGLCGLAVHAPLVAGCEEVRTEKGSLVCGKELGSFQTEAIRDWLNISARATRFFETLYAIIPSALRKPLALELSKIKEPPPKRLPSQSSKMKMHYMFFILSLFTAAVLSAPAQPVGKFTGRVLGWGLAMANNLGASYAVETEFVDTVEPNGTW